jgi:MoaA/NifB/PqqE/SkfB family radical SAM enzyme
MLDRFVAAEGSPEVVMLSGGEPTHPEIVTFIELAQERGIRQVFLNTNGIRLARDERFLAKLARVQPHIYLQLDGFDLDTHLAIRGKDLRADKERSLERCAEAGLRVTLAAAVEKGVNEQADASYETEREAERQSEDEASGPLATKISKLSTDGKSSEEAAKIRRPSREAAEAASLTRLKEG